jgi:hypothetical protein
MREVGAAGIVATRVVEMDTAIWDTVRREGMSVSLKIIH